MPTMADYIVIRDAPFDLVTGEERQFGAIAIPADRVPGTASAKAILQYKVRPPTSAPFAPSADIAVRFNGFEVETVKVTVDTVRGLWETFPATVLNADSPANFVSFRVEQGRIRISDVIVWFQRDI